jgi:hypothetical protein
MIFPGPIVLCRNSFGLKSSDLYPVLMQQVMNGYRTCDPPDKLIRTNGTRVVDGFCGVIPHTQLNRINELFELAGVYLT